MSRSNIIHINKSKLKDILKVFQILFSIDLHCFIRNIMTSWKVFGRYSILQQIKFFRACVVRTEVVGPRLKRTDILVLKKKAISRL